MTVVVENGVIDGNTSIGVRSGEFKVNPAQNVTGPVVTVTNVAITGASVSKRLTWLERPVGVPRLPSAAAASNGASGTAR